MGGLGELIVWHVAAFAAFLGAREGGGDALTDAGVTPHRYGHQVMASDASAAARTWFWRLPMLASPESDRLGADIEEFATDLERRGHKDAAWSTAAHTLLERARAERLLRRYGSGWSSLNAARREVFEDYNATEIDIAWALLRAEAAEKLRNWRGNAIETVLSSLEGEDTPERHRTTVDRHEDELAARRLALKEARQVLDDHLSTNYWKIDVLKREAARAGIVLALMLALTVAALAVRASAVGDAEFLSWPGDPVVVMVLGALGACVSGVLTPLSADRARRMPDLRAQADLGKVRPFLGAGAALIVVTVLRSGLGGIEIDAEAVPAAAMVAGFSERLLGQSVRAASQAVGS
jgi:hypothetical protein